MYKIMANRFSYQENTIQEEPTIMWHEEDLQNNVEGVEYTTSQDETLPENMNETYMTATGDNTTQYFSVLESGDDTISNEAEAALDHTVQETEEQPAFAIGDISEMVIYGVDGSDDLYGVQIGRDESGNLQKYQFKLRQTEQGTLEALSDSIQILPMDSEGINIAESEEHSEIQQADVESEPNQIFVKQEQKLDDYMPEDAEYAEEEIFEDPPDIKEGILESTDLIVQQKREFFEPSSESEFEFQNGHLEEAYYEAAVEEHPHDIPTEDQSQEGTVSSGSIEVNGNIPMYHHQELLENSGEVPEGLQGHYEQLFVKESHIVDENSTKIAEEHFVSATTENFLNDADDENESEDYETVDGVHVTGEMDADELDDDPIRRGPSFEKDSAKRKGFRNIIRQIRIKDPLKDRPGHFFYVVRDPENGDIIKFHSGVRKKVPVVRTNPRSILKTTLPKIAPKPPPIVVEEHDKYDKRFAKSKEAQQARQFHNFIAQTKIIHAPVRQERLPRKQTIKPMERTDQEIVVQEVVVSSNGFIETSEDGVLKDRVPLQPTIFIQLSDTEDENDDSKRKHKAKKRKLSTVEITISDSEDDDVRPDALAASQGKESEEYQLSPKRPRGRPPKGTTSEVEPIPKRPRGRPRKLSEKCTSPEESMSEESDEQEEEIIVIRVDNKCPKCPKSFPSEGSLRSHMQYHAYSSDVYKYICEICGEQFKNSVLLKRHSNAHQTKEFYCGVCKKVFSDQSQLIAHRRSHVKEQMFKATILPTASPRRRKTDAITCPDCKKIFASVKTLEIHARMHKKFTCLTCRSTFLSKLTLENHLRKSCVKSPMRRASNVPRIPRLTEHITNVKCDSCQMSFFTYTSLFKHKVSKHGLDTPGKNSGIKSKKPSTKMFSGIPANNRVQAACRMLKRKLAEIN